MTEKPILNILKNTNTGEDNRDLKASTDIKLLITKLIKVLNEFV